MSGRGVDQRVVHAGDRVVGVEIGGDPDGATVIHCHGTPGSRRLFGPWVEEAARQGIRLVAYDRPGYGDSSPWPGRSVADCAADVRAVAEALGASRIAVWGASGGGPHALACAALLPDLVGSVAAMCSLAPYGGDGLDFFAGMGAENVDDWELLRQDPEAARQKLAAERAMVLRQRPEELKEVFPTLLSDIDRAVFTDEFADWAAAAFHDGLAPGDEGWWEDGVAHQAAWGFDLSAIRVPVQVWHGAEDRFVPVQHGRWLAEHIPGAEAHISEDDGHLTLLTHRAPDVLDRLLAGMTAAA